MTIDRDALAEVIHDTAMSKPLGEAIFESEVECIRLADAVIAHLSAVPVEGDREALNVERENAAAERYPDIEADPPGTVTADARFPTGWSRESEREAFVTGAEWAAGFSRSPLPVEGEVEWEYRAKIGHLWGDTTADYENAVEAAHDAYAEYPFLLDDETIRVYRRPRAEWVEVAP